MTVGALAPAVHPLHGPERNWTETNCYLDLWIEVLHARGLDPVPACAAVLAGGWEVDQWTFVKPTEADLRALYGWEVAELNVWDRLDRHVVDHLAAGHLLTVEVDAWWLPDTAGTTYRTGHAKTSIAPLALDPAARTLRYAHNGGVHEAVGEDVDQLFAPATLPPYVELVRIGPEPAGALHDRGLERARDHLAYRSSGADVLRMGEHLDRVLDRLADTGFFHAYAFATWRQFGAAAEVAADVARWLDAVAPGAAAAAPHFDTAAVGAKSLQFGLARVSRGRAVDLSAAVAGSAAAWDDGLARLAVACGV